MLSQLLFLKNDLVQLNPSHFLRIEFYSVKPTTFKVLHLFTHTTILIYYSYLSLFPKHASSYSSHLLCLVYSHAYHALKGVFNMYSTFNKYVKYTASSHSYSKEKNFQKRMVIHVIVWLIKSQEKDLIIHWLWESES